MTLASATPVHPRGRGEHRQICHHVGKTYGSSPRARGTPRGAAVTEYASRFIPAGAGNTTRGWPRLFVLPVHPRGRGEHCTRTRELWPASRFIPAGAGNTTECDRLVTRSPVHPRGRGEHALAALAEKPVRGSSPRARGTHRTRRRTQAVNAVHPRGRGEHIVLHILPDGTGGSSPRARGTRSHGWACRVRWRFIPAGAGNTGSCEVRAMDTSVHPRGRGEHVSATVPGG